VNTEPWTGEIPGGHRVVAVIPAYRAAKTLKRVVARALAVADAVVVVDDACPDNSAAVLDADSRVRIVRHDRNRGVGGATKTGIAVAAAWGAEYIVKVDADDQMDTSYVPVMIEILDRNPDIDMVKGNRFADVATVRTMPLARFIGNSGLTFLVKFSSGYWTLVDPTNGFIAIRAEALRHVALERLADRYFFEIDLLCSFGLRRRTIAELEMPAIYAGETSSLSVSHALVAFPWRLFTRFVRRFLVNYVVVEINVASFCALLGIPLLFLGTVFGGVEWAHALATGIPRTTGTVVLALLLFMLGFQLTLQALLYDVQFSTRTIKVRRDRVRGQSEEHFHIVQQ
jgi:glycosyltransferase involved in cell wall biosynthesis